MGVAPAGIEKAGTGHHHLLVDTPLPPLDQPIPNDFNHLHFGAGQTEARVTLPLGTHTLQLAIRRRKPRAARSAGHVEADQGHRDGDRPAADAKTATTPVQPVQMSQTTHHGGTNSAATAPRLRVFAIVCALLSFLFTVDSAVAEKRVALVIGNAQYKNASLVLTNPKNDADDVATVLRDLGFEVIHAVDATKRDFDLRLPSLPGSRPARTRRCSSMPATRCSFRAATT